MTCRMWRLAVLSLLVVGSGVALVGADNLGEAARRESERRKGKGTPSYSEDDLKKPTKGRGTYTPPAAGSEASQPASSGSEPADPGIKLPEDNNSDAARASEEANWRNRAARARAAIKELERLVRDLEDHLACHQLSSIRVPACTDDSAMWSKSGLPGHIQDLAKDAEKARQRLAAARQALADLEEEARRKSIPPGWLRAR